MALAVTMQVDFVDSKNKSSSTKIRIPTGLTIDQFVEFAQDALQLIANINICRITGASLNFGLDLSGATLTNVQNVLADIGSKAKMVYNSAVAGLRAVFNIPTFDEDNLVTAGTDQIDIADTDVAAFLTGIEEGYDLTTGGVMAPVDKRDNDLTTPTVTRSIFVAHH
jgi:hypothetical protein